MKTITQRDFRNESAAVMNAVEQGETFRVTRHGVPIAEVRPILGEAFSPIAQIKPAFNTLGEGDFDAMRAESEAIFGEDRIDG